MTRASSHLPALLLLASACASAPPAPPPLVELAPLHYWGTILTGPQPLADAAPEEARDPWALELRIAYVDLPLDAGEPLAASTRRVLAERSSEPWRTRGELARGVRRLAPDATLTGATWEVRTLDVLLPGATTVQRVERNPGADDPPRAPWERFDVELSRGSGGPDALELALAFEGPVAPRVADEARDGVDAGLPQPAEPIVQREHVFLDAVPERGGAPVRLFLPAPRDDARRGGLVVELRLLAPCEAPDSTELAAAAELARADLARTAALASEGARALSRTESFDSELRSALAALESPRTRRPALLYLAGTAGAVAAGEVALLADEAALAEYVAALRAHIDEKALAFGWLLESTAYRWMAEQAEDPERGLADELRSLLLRRAGELGRYPDLLLGAVAESADVRALDARFVRENRIFLDDGHPAARVRAFDWLRARDAAPEAFDPLGPLDERRAALARAEEAAAAAGEQGEGR